MASIRARSRTPRQLDEQRDGLVVDAFFE